MKKFAEVDEQSLRSVHNVESLLTSATTLSPFPSSLRMSYPPPPPGFMPPPPPGMPYAGNGASGSQMAPEGKPLNQFWRHLLIYFSTTSSSYSEVYEMDPDAEKTIWREEERWICRYGKTGALCEFYRRILDAFY